ncbi:Precursor of CEP9 [Quillaja saponaria]|uniref:Precursor of CEP9 n=1 Tax=Quillaja saponaria TaxID=32244 RepID=A0AAD7KR00_QUISA|nr:Precursor of CEP9 [Quillaja saponaria]
MGEFHFVLKFFAILVALLVFHEVLLFSEGRKLKPVNQKESIYDHQPTPPPYNPSKQIHPPLPQNYGTRFFDDSAVVSTDDFRPTAPGNSPGVGHKHSFEKQNQVDHNEPKGQVVDPSLDVTYYVTARPVNDFKPTAPGHSPGVGHAIQTKMDNQINN